MAITAEQPKIYSPLIVLSFSKQGIKDALQNVGQGGFQSIVGGADVYTFPGHSSNFTKLTHTFNLGGVGMRIRLEVVDPVAEFENKFLSLQMEDIVANSLFTADAAIDSDIQQAYAAIEEGNSPIKSDVTDIIQASLQQKVWISYGHGTDTEKDWAGPFAFVLTGAKMKIDTNNIKKLTLDFTPNNDLVTNPVGWFGDRRISLHGEKSTAIGMTNSFKYGKITSPVGNKDYGGDGGSIGNWQKYVSKTGVDNTQLPKFFENFDVHSVLTTCIRGMVRQATNTRNVVVLIPNINVYAIKAIATAVACDRGSGVEPDKDLEVFLRDASEKVFNALGAEIFQFPEDNDKLLPTNFRESIIFWDNDKVNKHKKEDPYSIQMSSKTTVIDGHRNNIKEKLSLINRAIQNTHKGFNTSFIVESNDEIIKKFQGAPGIEDADSNIVFFGDESLIRNIVYSDGAGAAEYLHPTDKNFVGRGVIMPEVYPEFIMNAPDSNIISLDLIKDSIYLTALLAGFATNARSRIAQVGAELSKAGEAYGGNVGVDAILNPAQQDLTSINTGKIMAGAAGSLVDTDAKTTFNLDPAINNNPVGIITSAYEKLHKWAIQVSITTLPHFHLSNISARGQRCAILGHLPQAIIPGNPPSSYRPRAGTESSFFNGAYNIIGFEHEISSAGIAKSKFVLTKVIIAESEKEDPAPPYPQVPYV